MAFRISRSGSFGGFGSLDPFGSSRGGLGRYNLGSDVASIEATEAYIIALGWQNGTVSDEDYLASLKRLWDFAPPGTKEWEGARDKYNDAVYTIARNKIVNDVNLATSSSERVAGLRRLMAHDREHMGSMVEDNEQRRELAARIRSTEADIRSTEYGDLVEKYNRGQATTQQLIDFVNRAIGDSRGAPDNDDWQKTLGELGDRRNEEVIAGKYQDYQHNRQDGTDLLSSLKAQRDLYAPGSPKYLEISRQIEDLDRSIRETKAAKAHDKTYNDWQNGKITDAAYLKDLEKAASEAPSGTREEQAAKQRLLEARFSLAEDKLQYKVTKGTASKNDLIRFYRSYLATMNPDSYRARQLILAIDRLKGGGSAGGGGGGGGSSSSKGSLGEPQLNKILGVPVPFQTAMKTGKDANGKPLPPGALNDLLNLDASDVVDRNYYNVNRRSMDMAFDYGAKTWLFIDKKGNRYEIPFNAAVYDAFLERGEVGFRVWMDHARNPKEAMTAAGMWMTSAQRLLTFRGQVTFEEYRTQFAAAERAKQSALAAGNISGYIALTRGQQQLIREALGIVDPEAPTDVSLASKPLTDSQRAALASDIDAISPYQPMPPTGAGQDPQNLKGDKIMYAIANDIVKFTTFTVPGTNQTIEADVWVDENRAYFTQGPDGRIDIVTDVWDKTSFDPVKLDDETYIPAYKAPGNMVPTVLYQAPEWDRTTGHDEPIVLGPGNPTQVPVTVWVPVQKDPKFSAKLMVKLVDTGAGTAEIIGGQGPGMATVNQTTQIAGPAGASTINTTTRRPAGYQLVDYPGGVPLWTTRVKTWTPEGYKYQTWVSTEMPGTKGAIWLKLPNEGYGMAPRVVLDPKGVQFVRDADGKLAIRQPDGSTKTASADDLAPHVRFYNRGDGGGAATGIGAPGIDFDWTIADYQGRINTYRPASRAERETVDVVDKQGKLTTRQRTANLESEAQRQQRLVRARGAGAATDRNIDRQAYYDPGEERWVSGVRPQRPDIDSPTIEFPPRGGRSEYIERTTKQSQYPYLAQPSKSIELRGISRPTMAFPPQKGVSMTAPSIPLPTLNPKKPLASVDKTKTANLKPVQKKQYETAPKPVPKTPLKAPTVPFPPKPQPKPTGGGTKGATIGVNTKI